MKKREKQQQTMTIGTMAMVAMIGFSMGRMILQQIWKISA